MTRLRAFVLFIVNGARQFDELSDENDRLAASNEILRARVLEQQRTIDDLEAEKAAGRAEVVLTVCRLDTPCVDR